MLLTRFLRENLEPILVEFEAFARTQARSGTQGDVALRDHAEEILLAIAKDMETAQSEAQRQTKSQGLAPIAPGRETSAAAHGVMRQMDGFDLNQVSAEFRALRATVLRLWKGKAEHVDAGVLEEMTRFNEGMDQALAESIAAFSARTAESRDLFLAVLGHDLRSPLGSLSGCLQLLEKFNPPAGQRQRAFVIANRSVSAVDTMITDLLEYTRTRLGRGIEVVPQSGDFGALCAEAFEEIRVAYIDRQFDFNRSGELEVDFDHERMRQVLINLLGNAVQHGDPIYPIRFDVRGDEHEVQASVSNFGVPIPPESMGMIFDPLVQLNKSKTSPSQRPTTSLGLGLFIAREIVKAHGAQIDVSSSLEQGTAFVVRIPRKSRGS
jgi:signal transduction histidine kinase